VLVIAHASFPKVPETPVPVRCVGFDVDTTLATVLKLLAAGQAEPGHPPESVLIPARTGQKSSTAFGRPQPFGPVTHVPGSEGKCRMLNVEG